jgi:hypothetical protein
VRRGELLPPAGLEQLSKSQDNSQDERSSGTKSGTLSTDLDPDAAFLLEAWSRLPASAKTAILEMVRKTLEGVRQN